MKEGLKDWKKVYEKKEQDKRMIGIFNWKTGTPTEYGDYLVLHLDSNKRKVIHHDVWLDTSCCWQSNWHDIIAWCKYNDIKTYVNNGN